MAVSREPILKKCRSLGISPMVMGVSMKSKRNPNISRKKVSEYGIQLKEKQKLKFIYGVLERPFYHYYEIANKSEGKTGDNILTILESRLDNVVFRMGLSLTRRESRELVAHGHFDVNGKRVDIPSFRVKVGDTVSLREKSKKSPKFKEITEQTMGRTIPAWLDMDKEALKASVVRMPAIGDIDYEVQAHLVVELYSK